MNIVKEFVKERISIYEFSKKYSIEQEDLIDILKEAGFLYARPKAKSNLIIDNSYYLRNTCSVAVGNEEDSQYGVTQVESLTNEELKNYLNMYIQTENQQNWKKWKLGEEGYPIFE